MAKENRKKTAPPNARRLTFDFNRAVADARRDYPEETKDITFIDSAQPDAAEKLASWLSESSQGFKRNLPMYLGTSYLARNTLKSAGQGCAERDVFSGKAFLLASSHPTEDSIDIGLDIDIAKEKMWVFHHELGHLVSAGGLCRTPQDRNARAEANYDESIRIRNMYETHADCFSVLKGLHDGFLDAGDVEKIIMLRSDIINKIHNTTRALSALLKRYNAGEMRNMTPAQLKETAEKHAAKFAPKIDI